MTARTFEGRPLVGVLAVTRRGDELLLVQRRNPPDALKWGFPGGRLEAGETVAEGARRELEEETGVRATARGVLTVLDSIFRGDDGALQFHFVLIAILLDWQGGEAVAADDAAAVDWLTLDDLLRADRPYSRDVVAVARLALAATDG
jgi:ADP-ribose pyrophosphatase YjhB (NUDIX family)